MKNILILQGHPDKNSFSAALAESYYQGAQKAGHKADLVHLVDLDFALSLGDGERPATDNLEPDLVDLQQKMTDAQHVVLTYPTWWGGPPALVKGFIDRMLTVGYAFKYSKNGLPVKLLKGRSARIFITMDGPKIYYMTVMGAAQHKMLRRNIFGFVGFKPLKITTIGSLRKSSKDKRSRLLEKAAKLGKEAK